LDPGSFEHTIRLKRVYEPATDDDGVRLLVDRLWPRGISKKAARIDRWLKDLAPSHSLRREFHGHPEKWEIFRRRYFEELDAQPEAVDDLLSQTASGPVTLVYAARDERFNNAVALKAYLESGKNAPEDS
jgi:uncharacterized protein YeaO (DUF488 family)